MTKYKVKQSRLYDDLCHAILIMQALGTRKIILKCLNRLLELNNDNPEAKDLILTLFETIDEKPKKTIGSL